MRAVLAAALIVAVAVPMASAEGLCGVEGGCSVTDPACAVQVASVDVSGETVVTGPEDTYESVLKDTDGNLSMFAQQPLITVAADGLMARQKAGEWGWDLEGAAVMYGCLAAYELVGREDYLAYVGAWADHHIASGLTVTDVEQTAPGMALIALYEATKDQKYLDAARKLGDYLVSRPAPSTKTEDGSELTYAVHQDYIDTMLITGPFLAKLGELTADYRYRDAGVEQMITHIDYLRTKESMHNLFSKVYDFEGEKKFPYLDDGGQGWIFMQIAETADLVPEEHPQQEKLAYILSNQGCATLTVSPMVFGKAAGSLTISYSHAAYSFGAARILSGDI